MQQGESEAGCMEYRYVQQFKKDLLKWFSYL